MALWIVTILGLALLMVAHEGGHYLAARKFGMRVTRFSIGFGPTLYRHQPKGSPTIYQIGVIPFLAYVQIAGMNPYEEIDEKDPGSYANASLLGRIVTISAGSLTNYFFASVLFLVGLLLAGRYVPDEASMKVAPSNGGPAYAAGIREGDKIVAIDQVPVGNWDQMKKIISSHPGEAVDVLVERDGASFHTTVTPGAHGDKLEGKIQIGPIGREVPVRLGEALKLSVIQPAIVVRESLRGIARAITGKEKVELSGPVGIARELNRAAREGIGSYFALLGALSAYLGAFNLLPIPALDGGRLLFLLFEATSRKKMNAKIEARVHAVGLLMMLTLILFVTLAELPK
jgi:regulator of sigma E protease